MKYFLGIHTLWKDLRNCAELSYKKLPREEPELDSNKEDDDDYVTTTTGNYIILFLFNLILINNIYYIIFIVKYSSTSVREHVNSSVVRREELIREMNRRNALIRGDVNPKPRNNRR